MRPRKPKAPLGAAAEVLQRAHRVLLEAPAIAQDLDPDNYRLVARHLESLRAWHREHTGWHVYEGERVFRLRRRPSSLPVGWWESWRSKARTLASARDYAMLVLILAYTRSPKVLGQGRGRPHLITEMARGLNELLAAGGLGLAFDFVQVRDDRLGLMRAFRALQELGAIRVAEEDPGSWAEGEPDTDDPQGNILFRFTDVATALVVDLNPTLVEQALALRPDPHSLQAPPLDLESVPPLRRAWRSLLLAPVVLPRDDLAAFHALRSQATFVAREAEQRFGYALDITPQYARLVRHAATDESGAPVFNPHQAGEDQAAAALCSFLREAVEAGKIATPESDGCLQLTHAQLLPVFISACARFQEYWGAAYKELKPERILRRDVYPVLREAGLARGPDQSNRVLLLPTAACYTLEYALPTPTADQGPGPYAQPTLEF
jgi:uncharacterized protein (TIGR02678 family)